MLLQGLSSPSARGPPVRRLGDRRLRWRANRGPRDRAGARPRAPTAPTRPDHGGAAVSVSRRRSPRGPGRPTASPGPKYWQQWADYKLEAELNPVSKRLTGHGTIRYQNRSPDTLAVVYVQLLHNIFAPGAQHNTDVPWSVEGMELDKVVAQGQTLTAGGGETRPGTRSKEPSCG